MSEEKNVYEFHLAKKYKLFINLGAHLCYIEYAYSSEEGSSNGRLVIPIFLLPDLKDGIDKALKELSKEDPCWMFLH